MAKKIKLKGPVMDNDCAMIYHWIGWDAVCPNDLTRGLEEADGEDVILEVNSPGGYCDYAFEMYTALMEYKGNVEAHIICAASAMTVICCAADKRLISDTGMYMIHNTQAGGNGDYRDMIQIAECLSEYNESALNAYERCTGRDREELRALMDRTTWMSPKKAIEEGFVDGMLFGAIGSDGSGDGSGEGDRSLSNGGEPQNLQQIMAVMSGNLTMNMPGMIPKDKQAEIMALIRSGETADSQEVKNEQIVSGNAESDITEPVNKTESDGKGGKNMTLQELLKDNPEAQAEFDKQVADAKTAGVSEENSRLKSLDAISTSVSAEALDGAKYGEDRMDAKTLAYKALVEDAAKAGAYMKDAQDDATDSNVNQVGGAAPGENEEVQDADNMASYVNAQKGGK